MIEVRSFPQEEQETSLAVYRQDKIIEVYSSDMTVITKLKKNHSKGTYKNTYSK